MSKPIEVSFEWNKELAFKTSKLYYDYDMRHSNKRYVGWFFVALTQFGIVGALKHDSYGLLYISTFLVSYWYYGRWFLRKRMLVRFYDKNNSQNIDIHFSIDDDGFHGKEKNISWDEIIKVIELEEGVLIQSKEDALFFANAAFKQKGDKTRLLKMAKEKKKR
ncbi:FIG01147061: hypothetical protein [hydrothermal vent metagenome]|uniref:YcxB-like protein domain-containing protein n=1 Tax=hydrothermal vent metagenome TaxID=652676 RepID=A0A1W1CVY2_9ZZZZ